MRCLVMVWLMPMLQSSRCIEMNKVRFLFFVLLSAAGPLPSSAAEFKASPLLPEDRKVILNHLQKEESKWVPTEELTKYPGLYWQEDLQKQSFRIQSDQKGLEDCYFVPIQADFAKGLNSKKPWSQSLSLLLINRKDGTILNLPEHPVLEWSFDHISGVAFRDVQKNGRRAILVDAAGITGIGANGTEPFDVIAVYLPKDDGTWRLDPDLQKKIDSEMYDKCRSAKCRSLKKIIKLTELYFQKKK